MTLHRSPDAPPFLLGAYVVEERVTDWTPFPFNLPYVKDLDLELDRPVTLFVGENGSGKSTLLSALAELAGLPGGGGSRNELPDSERRVSQLAAAMRPKFRARPRDGFFFRADALIDFARILDRRKEDPDFLGDPYARYGGKSLRERSHGESVSAVFGANRSGGLFFFDEPESAFSPTRQLEFVKAIEESTRGGGWQFVIATHSPIVMSIPRARILDFDRPTLPSIQPEETKHWSVFKRILCQQ
jgi:predicted ATPase